jgi:hypothetical protein
LIYVRSSSQEVSSSQKSLNLIAGLCSINDFYSISNKSTCDQDLPSIWTYCDVGLPPVSIVLSILSACIVHTWHSYMHNIHLHNSCIIAFPDIC